MRAPSFIRKSMSTHSLHTAAPASAFCLHMTRPSQMHGGVTNERNCRRIPSLWRPGVSWRLWCLTEYARSRAHLFFVLLFAGGLSFRGTAVAGSQSGGGSGCLWFGFFVVCSSKRCFASECAPLFHDTLHRAASI